MALVSSLPACSGGGEADPSDASAHSANAPDGVDGSADAKGVDAGPIGPPAPDGSDEIAVTETPFDDILPDVGEAGIVFLRVDVDLTLLEEGQDPPACLACPNCAACLWRVMHVDNDGVEQLLSEESPSPGSGPRIVGKRVVWLKRQNGENETALHDLETGQTTTIKVDGSWLAAVPILQNEVLYWAGYSYTNGQHGIYGTDLESKSTTLIKAANPYNPGFQSTGAVALLGQHQPFALDGDRLAWSEWSSGGHVGVQLGSLGGGLPKLLGPDKGFNGLQPLIGDGWVAWKSYDLTKGCYDANCELTVQVRRGMEPLEDVTGSNADPTRFSRMTAAGTHLLWLDYRHGPYAIYARDMADPDGAELRLTSEQAVLSGSATPASHDGTVVWMDRRNGSWDIFRTALQI